MGGSGLGGGREGGWYVGMADVDDDGVVGGSMAAAAVESATTSSLSTARVRGRGWSARNVCSSGGGGDVFILSGSFSWHHGLALHCLPTLVTNFVSFSADLCFFFFWYDFFFCFCLVGFLSLFLLLSATDNAVFSAAFSPPAPRRRRRVGGIITVMLMVLVLQQHVPCSVHERSHE